MTQGNVLPVAQALMDDDFRSLQADMLRRIGARHRDDRLAHAADCTTKTIQNGRLKKTSLCARSLLNLLAVEPTALDELLAHFGLRAVPAEGAEAGCHMHLMAGAAGFTSTVAEALADGRIDHRERARIAEQARGLIGTLAPIVAAHDQGKLN